MRWSKKEQIRRLRDELETERANASARSILPMRSMWVGDDLEPEAGQRATALQAARIILGDITTSELLDAADFINDGTRYDEDGEEIESDEPGPCSWRKALAKQQLATYANGRIVFDEWNPQDTSARDRLFPSVSEPGSEFRTYEDKIAARAADRRAEYMKGWEQLISAARTPSPVFTKPAKGGKSPHVDGHAYDHDAGKMVSEAKYDEIVRNTPHSAPLVVGWPKVGEETARVEDTPLVPLDDEATRLEALRVASAVNWPEADWTSDVGRAGRAPEPLETWGDRWVTAPVGVEDKDRPDGVEDPPIDEDFDNSTEKGNRD